MCNIFIILLLYVQAEELRESAKEVAFRLEELREEADAWAGRSSATATICDDISNVSSCLRAVVQKCEKVDKDSSADKETVSKDCAQLLLDVQSKIKKVL